MSPTTTPTFVGFPSINFVSKCLKDFRDIHMTYLQPLSEEQCIYFTIITYLSITTCMPNKTLLCGSLRNDIFTIYQIGFIGTIIQWWSLIRSSFFHIPAKAANINLLCIICPADYITGESLRNGTFTICQIGFIGTIIQWCQSMQWNDVE